MKTISTLLAAILAVSTFCVAAQTAEQGTPPVITLKVKYPDGRIVSSSTLQGRVMRFEDVVTTTYTTSYMAGKGKLQTKDLDTGIKVKVIGSDESYIRVEAEAAQIDSVKEVRFQDGVIQLPQRSVESMSISLPYGAAPQKIGAYEISATRSN
jgi:hypothetical protein